MNQKIVVLNLNFEKSSAKPEGMTGLSKERKHCPMTGPHPAKTELEGATVYIHEQEDSGANVTHVDVEHPDLNEFIKPGENTFVGGKDGGVFIGLKDEMIERAEHFLEEREA